MQTVAMKTAAYSARQKAPAGSRVPSIAPADVGGRREIDLQRRGAAASVNVILASPAAGRRHFARSVHMGGIRTHEPLEDPAFFKSDDSHASGTVSHAITSIHDVLCSAETPCLAELEGRVQLECHCTHDRGRPAWLARALRCDRHLAGCTTLIRGSARAVASTQRR